MHVKLNNVHRYICIWSNFFTWYAIGAFFPSSVHLREMVLLRYVIIHVKSQNKKPKIPEGFYKPIKNHQNLHTNLDFFNVLNVRKSYKS